MVEPPGGSPARRQAPFLDERPGMERSFAHLYFNTNKRSVVLDLESDVDRDQLRQLLASADVFLETLPPGWLEKRGLAPESLAAANRRLVHCSLTPFGLTGAWRDWQANDLIAGAAGGLIQVSGVAPRRAGARWREPVLHDGKSDRGIRSGDRAACPRP